MGLGLHLLSGGLAMHKQNRLRILRTIVGGVNEDLNTLICGGIPGSISEERAHRILYSRFRNNLRRNEHTIFLISDLNVVYNLYQMYGDNITIYGHNHSFDPFQTCSSYNDISYILERVIQTVSEYNCVRSWCDNLVSLMQMSQSPLTADAFFRFGELLFKASNITDFLSAIAELGVSVVPASLETAFNRLWGTLCTFQHFLNTFSRQLGYLRAPRENVPSHQLIVYLPETDGEMIRASFLAGITLFCQRGGFFNLLSSNVTLKEDAEKLLTVYKVPFCMYVPVLSNLSDICLNTAFSFSQNFLCFGRVTGPDIDKIIDHYGGQITGLLPSTNPPGRLGLFYGSAPSLTREKFLRLKDGSAMIYTQNNNKFIYSINCL